MKMANHTHYNKSVNSHPLHQRKCLMKFFKSKENVQAGKNIPTG